MKRVSIPVAVLLLLAGAWVYYAWGPRSTPAGQQPLVWLNESGITGFEDQFNGASGEHRILILLSPT
jgi:hypothetical protein